MVENNADYRMVSKAAFFRLPASFFRLPTYERFCRPLKGRRCSQEASLRQESGSRGHGGAPHSPSRRDGGSPGGMAGAPHSPSRRDSGSPGGMSALQHKH